MSTTNGPVPFPVTRCPTCGESPRRVWGIFDGAELQPRDDGTYELGRPSVGKGRQYGSFECGGGHRWPVFAGRREPNRAKLRVGARYFEITVLAPLAVLDKIEGLVHNEWSDEIMALGGVDDLSVTQGIDVESEPVAWVRDPKTDVRTSADGRFRLAHRDGAWWLTMPEPAEGTVTVGPIPTLQEALYRADFHAEHDATCDLTANPGARPAARAPLRHPRPKKKGGA